MVHNDMQITILGMEQRKRARVTEIKYFANINTVWQTTQECILGEVKLVLLHLKNNLWWIIWSTSTNYDLWPWWIESSSTKTLIHIKSFEFICKCRELVTKSTIWFCVQKNIKR